MSALGLLLESGELNGQHLTASLTALLADATNDFGMPEVLEALTGQLAGDRRFQVLTLDEQADLSAIETYYNGLTAAQQTTYLTTMLSYTSLLQEGPFSVAQWDAVMGL